MAGLTGAFTERHHRALSFALVLVAALVASGASLWNGFALDDLPLIQHEPLVHSLADPWELVTSAYWRRPPVDTLWRPLGLLAFAVQWVIGNGAPFVFHALNVTLYLGTCAMALVVARQLLPSGPALLAGLLFAVHPVHVESVGNVVGQLELWVALAMLTAVALYVRDRLAGTLRVRTIVALVVLQLVGLGFKEHAVLLALLLCCAEVTVLRGVPVRPWGPLPGFARVRLTVLALLAVCALFVIVRTEIVEYGVAGEWPHQALRGLAAGERSWVMLGLLPEFGRLLVWPARLYADYSPQLVQVLPRPAWHHLVGAAWLIAWVGALAVVWRRSRPSAFALLWVPVSLALVSNLAVPTGILLAERTLFLATFGAALLAGSVAGLAWPALVRARRELRTAALVAVVALVGLAAAHSSERQATWRDNEAMAAGLIVDAPTNFRGFYWLGARLLEINRVDEGVAALYRARTLWPQHDGAAGELATHFQRVGRCDLAAPLWREVSRIEPGKVVPYVMLVDCLSRANRFSEARRTAFEGWSRAWTSHDVLAFQIVRTDSLLAAHDTVRTNNRWLARRAAAGR